MDEMQQLMEMAAVAARTDAKIAPLLHPEQARLRGGDAFVTPGTLLRTKGPRFLAWGLAVDDQQVRDMAARWGRPEDEVVDAGHGVHVFARMHALLAVLHVAGLPASGSAAVVHAVACWPITLHLYAAGMDADWDPERLTPGFRMQLEIVLAAYEAHMRGTGLGDML